MMTKAILIVSKEVSLLLFPKNTTSTACGLTGPQPAQQPAGITQMVR